METIHKHNQSISLENYFIRKELIINKDIQTSKII